MESIRQTPVETPAGTYVVHWFWDDTAPAEPPFDHACGLLKKGGPRTIDIREGLSDRADAADPADAERYTALRSVWSALACRRHPAWDPTEAVSGAALVRYSFDAANSGLSPAARCNRWGSPTAAGR